MALTRVRRVVVAVLLLAAAPAGASAQAPTPTSAAADPYYEFLLARHLEGDGDNAGALAALQRAAAADPMSAEVRAEIASFYMRRSQRSDAEKAAREAIAIDAGNVEANRVLGLLAAANADGDRNSPQQIATYISDAIRYLEKAAAGSTGVVDPNLNFTLGRLYLRTGQADKAQQALARVLSQNPGSRQARLTMAQAQAQNKDLKGAIQTLDEIVEDEPGVAAALAQYQEQAGLWREAVQNYTLALTVQPNSRQIKARRVLALYDAKDYARAAEFAAEAQTQHPDDAQFPRLQASALYAGGDAARAIEVLQAAVAKFPKDTTAQLALVDMYQNTKRYADAEKVLRQMLATDPNNADALNFLGYMLANQNDRLDEAIRLVNQALQKDPGNGAYLDSLGWAYFKKGSLNEAEKYLTQAAAKLPKNAEVLDHVGDLHAKRSRWQEAIAAWTQALQGEGGDVDRPAIEKKIVNAQGKMHNAK
jgi:tetratricopeptide (TPR) repeat protein